MTSIIILTHNLLALTRACINSVKQFTPEPHELILVDNGSTDGTVEFLNRIRGATVIANEENLGFPAAVNQGIRAARGSRILLLNNDTVVTPRWLGAMLTALHSAPEVGMVGPCSNNVSGPQRVNVAYTDRNSTLYNFAVHWAEMHRREWVETNRLVGFCLLVRRDVVEQIGLLDERFGQGNYEDADWCERAIQAGYRLLIARDSFVHHECNATFNALGVDMASLLKTNRDLYETKWTNRETQP